MKKKKEQPTIKVKTVIDNAQDCINRVKQWSDLENFRLAAKYENEADAFISLLEVKHCGSVGGFGVIGKIYQKDNIKYYRTLQNRLDWLKEAFKV